MRIGLITGEYPPDQGGVGDYTLQLSRALAAGGHGVDVLTERTGSGQTKPGEADARVHRAVRGWGWRCWQDVMRLSLALGCDIVNVQYQTAAYGMHPAINLLPWRFRQRHGPPVVVTFHDLKVPYLFPKAGALRWQAVLSLARWASGVIVTTREDEARLAGSGLRIEHCVRIPIGSNIAPQLPAAYDRTAWRWRWGVGPDSPLLGYFGFLNEQKGGRSWWRRWPPWSHEAKMPTFCWLAGGWAARTQPTQPTQREVDRLIADRGLAGRVHRTGFVSASEVSACLMAVDICVLPYREGASLRHGSLHACLAHGRPIVTTHSPGGDPDLRDGIQLLLVPPGDTDALAAAAERVWQDPVLRARLGAGARALAGEFTWDRIAARTVDFFLEVLA